MNTSDTLYSENQNVLSELGSGYLTWSVDGHLNTMSTLRKKVSFNEKPMFLGSAGRKDNIHSGILQHYHQLIVKHLSLTSPVYRRLKDNGIITTDQIGILELEESQERKVSKLVDILKQADHHAFTTFCAILHDTDHHHIAQILQKGLSNKPHGLPEVMPGSPNKQLLNQAILLHQEYDKTIKLENEQLRKKIKRMKNKYTSNLRKLEEQIAIARWERDLAMKEKNLLCSENEALQNLNNELQALIRRLQETVFDSDVKGHRTMCSHIPDIGFSVDYLQEKSRKFYPNTNLGLVYR